MEYRIKFHVARNAGTYEAFQIKVGEKRRFVSFSKASKELIIDEKTYEALSNSERFKSLFSLDVVEVYQENDGKGTKVKSLDVQNASGISDDKPAVPPVVESDDEDDEDDEDETVVAPVTTRRTARKRTGT